MSKQGLAYALAAYTFWGLCPIYWKLLGHVDSLEVTSHRMIWSLPFALIYIVAIQDFKDVLNVFKQPKLVATLFFTATLISLNWYIFIWAIEQNQLLQTSLGYFIGPLITVFLGRFILSETLSPATWLSIGLIILAVLYLIVKGDQFPWIALTLGASFSLYNLFRKTVGVRSVIGFTVEAIIIFPIALALLFWLYQNGQLTFLHTNFSTNSLLILAGLVTTLPLIWAVTGARLISLTMVGFIQYVNPSLQFLLAVFVYQESPNPDLVVTFIIIWIAISIYLRDNIIRTR